MNEMFIQHDLLANASELQSNETECASVSCLQAAEPKHITANKAAPSVESDESHSEPNVTEIIIAKNKADNMQLLLPMLTHLNNENRWLAWIDPPMELLKKWRSESNNDGRDIMVLRSDEGMSATAIAEKALAAGTCHAVILWTNGLNSSSFDKLEKASATGDSHCIVLRNR